MLNYRLSLSQKSHGTEDITQHKRRELNKDDPHSWVVLSRQPIRLPLRPLSRRRPAARGSPRRKAGWRLRAGSCSVVGHALSVTTTRAAQKRHAASVTYGFFFVKFGRHASRYCRPNFHRPMRLPLRLLSSRRRRAARGSPRRTAGSRPRAGSC